jgi:hypothetical protein
MRREPDVGDIDTSQLRVAQEVLQRAHDEGDEEE